MKLFYLLIITAATWIRAQVLQRTVPCCYCQYETVVLNNGHPSLFIFLKSLKSFKIILIKFKMINLIINNYISRLE